MRFSMCIGLRSVFQTRPGFDAGIELCETSCFLLFVSRNTMRSFCPESYSSRATKNCPAKLVNTNYSYIICPISISCVGFSFKLRFWSASEGCPIAADSQKSRNVSQWCLPESDPPCGDAGRAEDSILGGSEFRQFFLRLSFFNPVEKALRFHEFHCHVIQCLPLAAPFQVQGYLEQVCDHVEGFHP